MDKKKAYTFTKAEMQKIKAAEAKMTPAQKLKVSKALVQANSDANTPRAKKRKA